MRIIFALLAVALLTACTDPNLGLTPPAPQTIQLQPVVVLPTDTPQPTDEPTDAPTDTPAPSPSPSPTPN